MRPEKTKLNFLNCDEGIHAWRHHPSGKSIKPFHLAWLSNGAKLKCARCGRIKIYIAGVWRG